MLNKIINISPGSDFNHPNKFGKNGRSFYHNSVNEYNNKDSVNLSPAILYISRLNWHLKQIKNSSNDSIFIAFEIADLLFETTVEVGNLKSPEYLNYKIIKEKSRYDISKKFMAEITADIQKSNGSEIADVIKFNGLNTLFDRIFMLDVESEISLRDSISLNNLFEGIEMKVEEEFNYINNNLIIFVEKLLEVKLLFNSVSNNYDFPLRIEKIKALYEQIS